MTTAHNMCVILWLVDAWMLDWQADGKYREECTFEEANGWLIDVGALHQYHKDLLNGHQNASTQSAARSPKIGSMPTTAAGLTAAELEAMLE